MPDDNASPQLNSQEQSIYCLELTAPFVLAEEVQGFMLGAQKSGWEEEELVDGLLLRLYLATEQEADQLAREAVNRWPEVGARVKATADRDWAKAWREYFTAVLLSQTFVVLPPWMVDDHPYRDRLAIVIEPATAFGTGHHPTTAMCLEAIAELQRQGAVAKDARFLDLGTGSGILGLGMAMLGMSGLGVDIDPLAIRNAVENKALNGIDQGLELREGGLEAVDGSFDLIAANILAEPLMELAPDIVGRLAPAGCLILSGLLSIQANEVAKAYQALGMPEPLHMEDGEWAALVFKPAAK